MKTIKVSVLLCGLVVLMSACKKGGVFCYKADGNIVTEDRGHSNFSSISIGLESDLYIEQAEEYSVKIEGSQNLMEIIESEVKGSELRIDLKKRKCIKNNSQIKIYVTLPTLKDLSISGRGNVYAPNLITGDKLDISVSGSGNFMLDSLDFDHYDMNISGSGDMFLSAVDTAQSQDVRISGSGEIDALGLPVRKSEIRVSGSGECLVNVSEKLDVNISGSGDVRYKGHPYVDQDISGSGSVKQY